MNSVESTEPTEPKGLLRTRFSVADVLNTVCHDVRASLAVTTGSANELSSPDYGELSDLQVQLVGMIQRGNQRMARLAQNLMYLAELWEGGLELSLARHDLATFVRQGIDELRKQEPHNKVNVELELPDSPVETELDIERTRHVLFNIISMALAVARSRVRIALTQDVSAVVLTVEDDGPERNLPAAAASTNGGPGARPHKKVSSAALVYSVSEALMVAMGGTMEVRAEKVSERAHRFLVILSFPKRQR